MRISLKFEAGTVDEITGTKQEIIAQLEYLIEQIDEFKGDYQTVSVYDENGNDFIDATIEETED